MFYYSPAHVVTIAALTQDVTVEYAFTQSASPFRIEDAVAKAVAEYGECMVEYAIDGKTYKIERRQQLEIEYADDDEVYA